ncbi:hypothetical protein [Actinomadura welshii]|uniref:hypothetical protein n=1 Tax=Actinomadura welshii TaxID=3103817 RepID=UPI0003AD61D5|nr:hypothetical protein [Actinomadura madurae]
MVILSRVRTILTATAAAAVVMSSFFPGVAQAGQNAGACTRASGSHAKCAGSAKFQAKGEHFFLTDNAADGAGVFLQITVDGVVLTPNKKNTKGAGTTIDFNSWWPEGLKVEFVVCLTDDGVVLSKTCNGGTGVS